MIQATLMNHRGAVELDRNGLQTIEAPPPTDTWFPLKHSVVLDRVCETLDGAGFGIDTMQLASYIIEDIEELKPDVCFIDGNGVGGGVVDRVEQLVGKRPSCTIIEVQAGGTANANKDYFNKRAECWGLMRKWLAVGAIDDDNELRDDLCGPEYGFDSDNRIQLERKDDMKKRGLASPDDGDTLSLTFAEPVGRRDKDELKRKSQQSETMFINGNTEGAWMT